MVFIIIFIIFIANLEIKELIVIYYKTNVELYYLLYIFQTTIL